MRIPTVTEYLYQMTKIRSPKDDWTTHHCHEPLRAVCPACVYLVLELSLQYAVPLTSRTLSLLSIVGGRFSKMATKTTPGDLFPSLDISKPLVNKQTPTFHEISWDLWSDLGSRPYRNQFHGERLLVKLIFLFLISNFKRTRGSVVVALDSGLCGGVRHGFQPPAYPILCTSRYRYEKPKPNHKQNQLIRKNYQNFTIKQDRKLPMHNQRESRK